MKIARKPGRPRLIRPAGPDKMSIAELEALGRATYGAPWQGHLAARLGCTARTVQRWVTGKRAIDSIAAVAVRLVALANPHK